MFPSPPCTGQLSSCGETAHGRDTKTTKLTKITKITKAIWVFVIFVAFVIFVTRPWPVSVLQAIEFSRVFAKDHPADLQRAGARDLTVLDHARQRDGHGL